VNPDDFDTYTAQRVRELESENAPYDGIDNFWLGATRFFDAMIADGQRRRHPDPMVRFIQQEKDRQAEVLERRMIDGE
jgi:hypothetical protein